jgi:hypothetical protein
VSLQVFATAIRGGLVITNRSKQRGRLAVPSACGCQPAATRCNQPWKVSLWIRQAGHCELLSSQLPGSCVHCAARTTSMHSSQGQQVGKCGSFNSLSHRRSCLVRSILLVVWCVRTHTHIYIQ